VVWLTKDLVDGARCFGLLIVLIRLFGCLFINDLLFVEKVPLEVGVDMEREKFEIDDCERSDNG
jgi:hypothetical protein